MFLKCKFNKILVLVLTSVFIFLLSSNNHSLNAYGWGFRRNDNHQIVDVGMYEEVIKDTNSFYVGRPNKVYLTFDSGYDLGTIDQIIDILNDTKVPATFFLTGDFIERNGDLVKRMDECSFITIGNHTYSHKNITKISDNKLYEEIKKTEDFYYNLTGKKMCKLFRPPEGEFDRDSLLKIKNLGYYTFFWSIAFYDWDVKKSKGVSYSINSVCNNLHDGSIILLHSVNPDNVKALRTIIKNTKEFGYEFDNLESLTNTG